MRAGFKISFSNQLNGTIRSSICSNTQHSERSKTSAVTLERSTGVSKMKQFLYDIMALGEIQSNFSKKAVDA